MLPLLVVRFLLTDMLSFDVAASAINRIFRLQRIFISKFDVFSLLILVSHNQ
jgi:hypothetical protein